MENSEHWLEKLVIEQHWNHIRHIESERRWFFMAFGTVVGGSLFFLTGDVGHWERVADLGALFFSP